MADWGVQKEAPDRYLGQLISTYIFEVTNSPLEIKYGDIFEKHGWGVEIAIMLTDGQVIGGYSTIINKDRYAPALAGNEAYSLDGLSLEELTDLNWPEWHEEWMKK